MGKSLTDTVMYGSVHQRLEVGEVAEILVDGDTGKTTVWLAGGMGLRWCRNEADHEEHDYRWWAKGQTTPFRCAGFSTEGLCEFERCVVGEQRCYLEPRHAPHHWSYIGLSAHCTGAELTEIPELPELELLELEPDRCTVTVVGDVRVEEHALDCSHWMQP